MNVSSEETVQCPYCGENIDILVDQSIPQQDYIEDCQVCCRPISLCISVNADDDIKVVAVSENE